MDRRRFLLSSGTLLLSSTIPARAQSDALIALLAEVAADPAMVENSWFYRERIISRGVGHGAPSKRLLNGTSKDLIIAFEIASKAAYQSRYRHPIWPKGASGVTIGIGYDLRFANKTYIDRDWPWLSAEDRALLINVATLGGTEARDALPTVQSVDVPWDMAYEQFIAFIPYPTKDTEKVFPNTAKLNDDCFGALVSLVYNRGPKISQGDSRREMFAIQQLMKSGQEADFAKIPEQIRSMKRLWTTPDSRGLIRRREAEALLFEKGLQSA
jgi:hypothetical protein